MVQKPIEATLSGRSAIDAAFNRAAALDGFIAEARELVRRNPSDTRLRTLAPLGAKLDRDKLLQTLDSLQSLVDHIAILDMATAFESSAKARISTRIGETRGAVEEGARRLKHSPWHHAKLIHSAKDYAGLHDVFGLLEGLVDKNTMEALGLVRSNRNEIAHGKSYEVPPTITRAEAQTFLTEALEAL